MSHTFHLVSPDGAFHQRVQGGAFPPAPASVRASDAALARGYRMLEIRCGGEYRVDGYIVQGRDGRVTAEIAGLPRVVVWRGPQHGE